MSVYNIHTFFSLTTNYTQGRMFCSAALQIAFIWDSGRWKVKKKFWIDKTEVKILSFSIIPIKSQIVFVDKN